MVLLLPLLALTFTFLVVLIAGFSSVSQLALLILKLGLKNIEPCLQHYNLLSLWSRRLSNYLLNKLFVLGIGHIHEVIWFHLLAFMVLFLLASDVVSKSRIPA